MVELESAQIVDFSTVKQSFAPRVPAKNASGIAAKSCDILAALEVLHGPGVL